jgi:hypothetical protein
MSKLTQAFAEAEGRYPTTDDDAFWQVLNEAHRRLVQPCSRDRA